MLEQVSLLPNKIRHLEVCNTLWKLRFNKINDKVRRKIVRNVRASTKSIQVQVVKIGSFKSMWTKRLVNKCQVYRRIRFCFFMSMLEQGCFTSHLLSFDNNKVLKIINSIC